MKLKPATRLASAPNGSIAWYTAGEWSTLAKVERAPCEDGKKRTVHVTGSMLRNWLLPARTYVYDTERQRSVTVTGFLHSDSGGYRFIASITGKNYSKMGKRPCPKS